MKICSEEKFWIRIKELLKDRNLSLKTLAQHLKIDDQRLRNLIYLKKYPSITESLQISDFLNISLNKLLSDEPDENNENEKKIAEIIFEINKIPEDKFPQLLEFLKLFSTLFK